MRLTVHLRDDLAEKLKAVASNEGRSVSAFVAHALEDHLIHRRRRQLGNRVLEIAAKHRPAPDTLDLLEEGRSDDRS